MRWRTVAGLLCGVALGAPVRAENGYSNVVNRRWATVADGPLGALVIDVTEPAEPAERTSRLRRPTGRATGRRVGPAWFQLLQERRLLPADQPPPALPRTVFLRRDGRLLRPDLEPTRQASTLGREENRITFDFTTPTADGAAVPWSQSQLAVIQQFLTDVEPVLRRVYGPPAFELTVRVVHDPGLNELDMAVYDVTTNEIRLELLHDVLASNPANSTVDDYDLYVLTLTLLKAWRDDAALFFDCWEDGLARAAQLLVISQVRPDFGFLARDFNLMYGAYEVLNQEGLESPSFLGANAGSDATIMREALATVRAHLAQAAWLKAYAENPNLFAEFNRAYYAALATNRNLPGDIPRLKNLMRLVAPTVEGLSFDDWYRRQHVLDTSVIPGAKIYVFNIPTKDFFTGEPTNSLPMNVYHFQTTAANEQKPLTGRIHFDYFAYDEFDLGAAVEGASGPSAINTQVGAGGNPAGIGSAVPLFFNIAGDQQVQMQRIRVEVSVNGLTRLIWYPNDVAADDRQSPYHLYGLVTNGYQGTLTVAIEGKEELTANVVQGAFRLRVPGGLPVPAKATFTWTPDSSGGSFEDALRRNVMFLGPIGSGLDVETGDAIVILETPPETTQPLRQSLPAGLRMITLPAFAHRTTLAEVLGLDPGQLLLARADGAATSFESWRLGSIYRLWPNTPPFRPGYAYWLQLPEAVEINYQGVTANRDRPFRQHYPAGWQQFGNPYTDLNIALRDLKIEPLDGGGAITLAEAQARGIVSSGVFRYNPTTGSYELLGEDSLLTPFEGFWINFLSSAGATIVFPNTASAVRQARVERGRSVDPARWQASLVAVAGELADTSGRFGVAPGAGDEYSRHDLAKPPPFGNYVSVSFPRAGWGERAGRYAVDLQEADGREKTWDVLVESNAGPREVTLTWPDLARVPAGVDLVLTDLESGRSRFLRSTAGYTFPLGGGGSRRFILTARRAGATSLAVTNLAWQPGRGAGGSVSYTLTAPAEVTVNLGSASGRLIRTLTASRASAQGTSEVAFQAVDAQGRPLPAGIYRLELIALAADGRQVRTSRVVRVER